MTKQCFKCLNIKCINEFYRHPMMADGHLGKCKECTRRDAAERAVKRRDYIAAYEKKRAQDPRRKELARQIYLRIAKKHPERKAANTAVSNAIRSGRLIKEPCRLCGATERIEAHHEDYAKPLDVIWLCRSHHAKIHRLRSLGRELAELNLQCIKECKR